MKRFSEGLLMCSGGLQVPKGYIFWLMHIELGWLLAHLFLQVPFFFFCTEGLTKLLWKRKLSPLPGNSALLIIREHG